MSYAKVNNLGSQRRTTSYDNPPPPYSETDIYSSSGAESPFATDFAEPVTGSAQDSQSTTGFSTSTASGEVIYTPSLTPTSTLASRSTVGSEVVSFTSSLLSAAAYFESRPPTAVSPGPGSHVLHTVTITPDSTPDGIPYPPSLAGRDVSAEDWRTFVNYLLPDHVARANEAVIERKLKSDGGGGGCGSSRSNNGSGNGSGSSLSGSIAHTEAKLGQIYTPSTSVANSEGRRDEAEMTVREWNEGFFAPRGVMILSQFSLDDDLNPWESASASHSSRSRTTAEVRHGRESHHATPNTETPREPLQRPGIQDQEAGAQPPENEVLGLRFGTLNLGPLQLDGSGIRFDGRPLLPGLSVMNARGHGARHGRGHGFAGTFFPSPPTLALPGLHHAVGSASSSSSTQPAVIPVSTPLRCPGSALSAMILPGSLHESAPPPHKQDLEAERNARGLIARQRRGGGDKKGSRAGAGIEIGIGIGSGSGSGLRSSSVASARSASSASSAGSIESLPAYEDLADEQIPVARDLLRRWLDSPGQAITRDNASLMNKEIRSARAGTGRDAETFRVESRSLHQHRLAGRREAHGNDQNSLQDQNPTQQQQPEQQQGRRYSCAIRSWRALPSAEELAVLRDEVKEMSKQWKAAKRVQERSCREERQERHRDRRAERRERRQAKRDIMFVKRARRREARDMRWGRWREGEGEGEGEGSGVGGGGGLFGIRRLIAPGLPALQLHHVPPRPFAHCCGHKSKRRFGL